MIPTFQVKVDGWKLINIHQRPVPKTAEDIGNWQTVFSVIATIAVVTNAGLICFTMSLLNDYTLPTRMWIFFGFQWALILMQQGIEMAIPDEPLDVSIQRRRNAFIVSKAIDKVPDEDEEETESNPLSVEKNAYTLTLMTYPDSPGRKSEVFNQESLLHGKFN